MSLYIVTLTEMKAELGLTGTGDDIVLTEWIEGLQARFDEHLNRTLLRSGSAEEIFDGGVTMLRPKRYPIESVAEIVIDGDQDWGDANSILASDDYLVDKGRGQIFFGHGDDRWPTGRQCIRLTYAGGYVGTGTSPGTGQTAMPDAIRRAMFMQLGFEWRNRTTLGIAQVSADGSSKQAGADVALALQNRSLMSEVEQTLANFVRW